MVRWGVIAFAAAGLAACKASPTYGTTTTTGGAVEAGQAPPPVVVLPNESALRSPDAAPPARGGAAGSGASGDESIDRARSARGTPVVQPPLAPPGDLSGPPRTLGPTGATPAMNGQPYTDEGSRNTGSSSDDDGGVIPFWGTSF